MNRKTPAALSRGGADGAQARRSQAALGQPGRRSRYRSLPNDRWSLDFVSDQLANGRRFRVLTIIDDVHPASAWPRSPTSRCRASGWRASWTR